MPRLIFKCPYLKGGEANAAHLSNYVRYMATREGAQAIDPGRNQWPATKKQQQMVAKLIRDFPLSRGMFEYEDYQAHPTRANASEFITRALEDNYDQVAKRENYMDYIAQRPHAQRVGSHALFTGADAPLVLSKIADEVAHHPGNVWLPIFSLRREDAARLGYDTAQRWQTLLSAHAPEIAKAMKIPLDDFRWYAAFHDEGHHPHVHMVCYSTDGTSGFLTKEGIAKIKSSLVKDIFQQELTELYQSQTKRRDELTAQARETMGQLIAQMETGTLDNPRIEELTSYLAQQLRATKGKKVYGYLKPDLKAVVDEIVDELAKDPRVAQAYGLWYSLREDVLRSYKDDLPKRLPLSQQKEFKSIKNMVIREALRLGQMEQPEEQIPDPPLPDAPAPEVEDTPPEDDSPPDYEPKVEWSGDYKQGRVYLYGSEEQPPDFQQAHDLFLREAESGNALAMCDLGRMYADGLGREPDPEMAQEWYAKALEVFQALEDAKPNRYIEYRIGKLYAVGLGTEQDYSTAADWFGMAAEQGHKYAQYSLAGLYLRGQGVTQSDEDAYRLYSASARQGFPYAAFELGKLLRDGKGCEADSAEADEWFRRAYQGFHSLEAQSHDDKLQYRLGWMKLHGVGTEQSETEARAWFEKAAGLGNPHAQYQLTKLILADESAGPEEVEQAVMWLTQSAEAGQDCAQYALGKLYRDGRGVQKNILQAVIWFSAAAEQDNSYAAYALGKLYLTGEDAPKNVKAALRWLQRSAGLGNQYAQYKLGALFLKGEDIPKDIAKAVEYLTASAGQGNQYAQYQLGKLYLLGREVEKDEDAARQWFTQSAAQGNEYAQWFLDHWGEFQGSTPFQCATRLLYHLSRIFQEQTPRPALRVEVDKKLRRRIREKKIAMGHKPDDHEEQTKYNQTM